MSHSSGAKPGSDGGSRVVFCALAQPMGDTDVFLFDIDFELFGSGYLTNSSVFSC